MTATTIIAPRAGSRQRRISPLVPAAGPACCGVPMTRRGNRWECDECFGWATAHHRPAADTQPHPPMNRRAARSACTQGR